MLREVHKIGGLFVVACGIDTNPTNGDQRYI